MLNYGGGGGEKKTNEPRTIGVDKWAQQKRRKRLQDDLLSIVFL